MIGETAVPRKRNASEQRDQEPFPFWSGTLTFGLVSVPVDLYPAVRTHRVALRMLSPTGQPLRRQYYCSADDKPLRDNEIVRGYEQEDGSFIVVTDEELDALAPRKSRDIDLRVFVERDEIPVRLFERPYVLAPGGESTRAYHLLVETMERTNLAGIATFVMRGKEHLAAIVADDGLLRASTLHFSDEIRSPEDIGLPSLEEAPAELVRDAKAALRRLAADDFDSEMLRDVDAAKLLALAEEKFEAGRDVVEVAPEAESATQDQEEVIDIMAVLKRRMAEANEGRAKSDDRTAAEELEAESKEELYQRAQVLDLEGRSKMSKEELIDAIVEAS